MGRIAVGDLLALATDALRGQGFEDEPAGRIAEEIVIAEFAGIKTHGVGKLVSLNLGDLSARPTIVEHGAVLAANGNGGNGFLLMEELARLLADRAPRYGIAAAFAHNHSRYSSLYPYTDMLARRGLVAMLTNTAGPPAVAPFGSVDPVTGTNPLCFSFPTAEGTPQTFDFATSDRVWGEIRQASLEGRGLPSGPFLDAAGDVTTTPADVNAVRAFGGAKGWALNLALEIIAGPLAGAPAGLEVDSEFDCGAMLLAIDPRATGAPDDLAPQVSRLMQSIRESRPETTRLGVRAPGDRGRSQVKIADHASEELDVPDVPIEMMKRMSAGESISELRDNPLFN